jgi:hypothetical protein
LQGQFRISNFNTLFLFLIFTPTFGVEYGGIIVNLLAFTISLIYIFLKGQSKAFFSSNVIAGVFLSLSLLIVISAVFDLVSGVFTFGSFFSMLRPFFIWTIVTSAYVFWDTRSDLIEKWNAFCNSILAMLTTCALLELLFPFASTLFDFLYGTRSSLLSGPLGTSYYFGYLAFLISIHYLFQLKYKFSTGIFIRFLIGFTLVFLSDSKPPLVSLIILIPLLFFPQRRLLFALIVYLLTLLFAFFILPIEPIIEFLVGLNIDSYNISSLIRILSNAEGAGTYSIRQEQIDLALFRSTDNYGFGVGLGRELLLESWISYYAYRYGIIGLAVYIFFWVYLAVELLLSGRKKNLISGYFMVYLGLWFLFQPVLLLSGGMNESGMSGVFGSIVIGFSMVLIKRKYILINSVKE